MMEDLLIRTRTLHPVSDSTGDEAGPSPGDVAVTNGSVRLLPDEEDEDDIRAAKEALREARELGTIPWEQMKRELDL